ncbi:Protein phosphatase 1 regulatory subunit 14B [Labeo rohita]|uniref:Protein phosphatase 1 regulatory subunit 14B n=1 Tax=Labeo rohita TaxID=84645 RepID=A0ABQ8LKY8_LABRO|nr:Protein phosphatase 1 regulatory subunit 14B [Labeo rohita]
MAAVTSPETTPQPRVYFQTPPGTEEEVPQKQGRVTVKYDRKELRRRLNLEEWIVSQLMNLYDCEEDEVPELEIDVDELLDLPSDVERAIRVKMLLVDCYKPNDVRFRSGVAGESPRDAKTQHPPEERGADAVRSPQLLPPPPNQPVTPNPGERCRHADPTTKPQRLSNGDQ